MSGVQTVVFSDFDGTIARCDIGNRLFHHFSGGKSEALIPAWKAGEITSREILIQEAALFRGTEAEVLAFLDSFELDSGFVGFEELCRSNNTPLVVLSDGLDLYINLMLKKHGLGHIPIHSNAGRLENGGIRVEFPYALGACGRCGNCKGERIAEYRAAKGKECRVVFVGDGLSDTCAASGADLLFAKKDLKQYCVEQNIGYFGYDTFDDVASQLLKAGWLK